MKAASQKLEKLRLSVRNWYREHQSLHLGIGLIVTLLFFFLMLSGSGNYLNRFFYVNPVAKIRAKLDMLPTSDPSIGMILVEDRSLKQMGRHPTFAEWQSIANLLFDFGIEKIFFLGESDLSGEVGTISPKHSTGKFILSAVNTPSKTNSRADKAAKLPSALLINSIDDTHLKLPKAEQMIAPNEAIHGIIDHIGHINIHDDDTFDIAYRTSENTIMLNFPLHIMDNLAWRNGSLWRDYERIPMSPDFTLMYNFVQPMSAFSNALPVRVFFDESTNRVKPELAERTKKRLENIKNIVIVKEAFQGSRIIDSPFGKVPSYLATVSVISSALKGEFLYRPTSDFIFVGLSVPILIFLLAHKSTTVGLGGSMAIAILQLAICTALMILKGWVLPSAQIFVLALSGWIVRLSHYSLKTLSDKLLLSKDLAMGQAVQKLFLPEKLEGRIGAWKYRFVFEPYGPMSGDWIQVFESPPEVDTPFVVVAIGDVIGKGPSAALNTAVIASIWNDFAKQWRSGEQTSQAFVEHLHQIIFATFKSSQNTTLSLAYLAEDHITVFSCGAPPWLRINLGGKCRSVRIKPSDPLGISGDASEFEGARIQLDEGEVLMAHTDGVMDSGRSRKRFLKLMSEHQVNTSGQIFKLISGQAREVGKQEVLPDDFTMVMIQKIGDDSNEHSKEPQAKPVSDVA